MLGLGTGLGRTKAAAPDRHTILTITNSGGNALVTTAAPHGLSELASVTLSGCSVADYDGQRTVASVPSANTFTDGAEYIGDSSGGRWD